MKTKAVLELDDVRKIVLAAEAEANKNRWKVTIAVCDDGGNPIFLQRMDGAPPMSARIAPEKARTCVMARRPSKAYEEMINKGRYAALSMPVMPLEGGEMIVVDGQCIGAVGVSGAQAGEDALVARSGIAAIGAATAL